MVAYGMIHPQFNQKNKKNKKVFFCRSEILTKKLQHIQTHKKKRKTETRKAHQQYREVKAVIYLIHTQKKWKI